MFEPENQPHSQESVPADRSLTNPTNKVLESGSWTQSIIWSPTAPFRDFTALELNEEEAPEERLPSTLCAPHDILIFVDFVLSRNVQIQEASPAGSASKG